VLPKTGSEEASMANVARVTLQSGRKWSERIEPVVGTCGEST
jgi:hypothetical protein